MRFLEFIARWFINFFGITQPTPQQERQAAWFISGLLVLILLVAAGVFFLVVMSR